MAATAVKTISEKPGKIRFFANFGADVAVAKPGTDFYGIGGLRVKLLFARNSPQSVFFSMKEETLGELCEKARAFVGGSKPHGILDVNELMEGKKLYEEALGRVEEGSRIWCQIKRKLATANQRLFEIRKTEEDLSIGIAHCKAAIAGYKRLLRGGAGVDRLGLKVEIAKAYNRLGEILLKSMRYEDAKRAFEDALESDKNNKTADINLGSAKTLVWMEYHA